MQATSHDFGEITNVTSNTFGKTVKPGQNYIIRGIIKLKKELKWGTLHQTMTHQFKNIINLAIEDAKYNLCDIISSLTATEKKLQWGILHIIITHQFKNYLNLTFVDAKYNLCDMIVSLTNEYCPLKLGIYHGKFEDTIPSLDWPGKFHFKAIAYNENSDEIYCGMIEVDIEK
uniref:MD-2-related lipid-recognition domain-containing protein n=1 Tax=Amphimedon queenslandica TaxID=400682 RepID=A0A1X7TQ71_AMPQE